MSLGGTLFEHFKNITDPRIDRTKEHQLFDIIVIAICAILCGADSWTEIELFGKAKRSWFKQFLELPGGIPSHDTFGRVFSLLDPIEFETSFESWVSALVALTAHEVIAVDGKTVRRSHARGLGKNAIHLVSAFATTNGLTLAQRAIATKSNELKAIPKLLKVLAISGCTVTIDAAGCYPEIVETIAKKKADYIIAVKQNQPTLYADIEHVFAMTHGTRDQVARTEERGHGRTEIRECTVLADEHSLEQIRTRQRWKNLASVVKITGVRTFPEKPTKETRYYISSLKTGDARQMLTAVRSHWGIENSLHWILDLSYREDESRIRTGHAQQNFALMRKMTLTMLTKETTTKVGIKAKRLKAGWDEEYLLKLLRI